MNEKSTFEWIFFIVRIRVQKIEDFNAKKSSGKEKNLIYEKIIFLLNIY